MTYFTKQEKKTISILSIGTFLEYFDFYLYFHFATVLNKVFFMTGDSRSIALMNAFAYCSSFLFRPVGAALFGYIGDKYGRKRVIDITFILMGVSCLGIFFLPSYDTIGVYASIMITLFRAMQGISTMGEVLGGEIYLTEYLKGRKVFVAMAIIAIMCNVSCIVALLGINLAMDGYFNWRYLFLLGMVIFILGYIARKKLVETPDFIKYKSDLKSYNETVDKKFLFFVFVKEMIQPCVLFLSILGINNILRNDFDYTESDIIARNLNTVYFSTCYFLLSMFLSFKYNPAKLAIIRNIGLIVLLIASPVILNCSYSVESLIIIQSLLCFLGIDSINMSPIVFKSTIIKYRFMISTLSFALSRAIVSLIFSFGLIFTFEYFGNYMFLVVGLPFALLHFLSIFYFIKIDKSNPNGLLRFYDNSL